MIHPISDKAATLHTLFFYAFSHYIIRMVTCLVSTMESEEMRKCKCYIGNTEE